LSESLWVETSSESGGGFFSKIAGVVESFNLLREFFRLLEAIFGVKAFAMGLDFDGEFFETRILDGFSVDWVLAGEVKRFGTSVAATITPDSSRGIRSGPIEAVSTLLPFVVMVLLGHLNYSRILATVMRSKVFLFFLILINVQTDGTYNGNDKYNYIFFLHHSPSSF